MRKLIFLSGLIIISFFESSCQSETYYKLSKEIIVRKNSNIIKLTNNKGIRVKGLSNGKYALFIRDSLNNRQAYLFDEIKQEIYSFKAIKNLIGNKIIDILVFNDIILKIGYYNVPDHFYDVPIDKIPITQFEYQDFWIQYKDKNIKIDSFPFHYLDKYISCNFSDDGKKLVCNPYTSVSAGYSPEIDNKIYVYDLQRIDNGIITKKIIPCEMCMNTFIINDTLYFQKEIPIGRGYDGYYKNIYKAPFNNINDTVLIAHDIELKNITPDGAFILGEKCLYGEFTPVLINVKTKRYQYILGRKYPTDNCYYSYQKEKFVYDFGELLVYIEFPLEYPFYALKNTMFQRTTKAENEAFWEKYKHKPFK